MAKGKPTNHTDKDVFTTGQVAAICNVTIRTVIRWFETGILEGYKIPGSKDRRIPRDGLVRFMKAYGIPLDKIDGGGPKRILIADDDENILTLLAGRFEQLGLFDVHTATTGYQAGLATARLKPHVLLLDYLFGDTTGDEVAKAIREDASLSHVRIIVMSGHLTDAEGQKLLDQGVDAYLRKPLDFDKVKETVFEALQLA